MAFRIVPSRYIYCSAHGFDHLYGSHTNAAASSVNEYLIAFLEPAYIKDVVPHRKKGFRKRSGFNPAKSLGQWKALRRRYNGIFRISSSCNQSANRVADL